MAENTVGFAIVGTGMAAELHEKAIRANHDRGARLVAVCRHDTAAFETAARRFGVPCLSYRDLLRHPQVDVVCLCTPSGLHASQAIAAAAAGKHALVEKPLAVTLADADAMIAAFTRAGRLLGVALQRRAEPLFKRIRRAVLAGELGSLTAGQVTIPYLRDQAYYDQAVWRGTWVMDGGGVLMNQGIHLIDLLVWYMGDPLEIRAMAATLHREIEVEDTVGAVLRFAGGSLAGVTATTVAPPGFPHRLEIYGTRGGIQVEGETVRQWRTAGTAVSEEPGKGSDAGAGADPRAIRLTGHIGLIGNFLDAIRGGEPLLIDGNEGRRSLATVLGIYEVAGLKTGNADAVSTIEPAGNGFLPAAGRQ
jgi:UDP-N-acetyl-2-amino-2-deoxyglucuronate dehydrogenase